MTQAPQRGKVRFLGSFSSSDDQTDSPRISPATQQTPVVSGQTKNNSDQPPILDDSDDDDTLIRATDHVLVACKESLKAVLRGNFQLLSQLANGAAGALMHFIHEEHYHVTRRERLRSESTSGSIEGDHHHLHPVYGGLLHARRSTADGAPLPPGIHTSDRGFDVPSPVMGHDTPSSRVTTFASLLGELGGDGDPQSRADSEAVASSQRRGDSSRATATVAAGEGKGKARTAGFGSGAVGEGGNSSATVAARTSDENDDSTSGGGGSGGNDDDDDDEGWYSCDEGPPEIMSGAPAGAGGPAVPAVLDAVRHGVRRSVAYVLGYTVPRLLAHKREEAAAAGAGFVGVGDDGCVDVLEFSPDNAAAASAPASNARRDSSASSASSSASSSSASAPRSGSPVGSASSARSSPLVQCLDEEDPYFLVPIGAEDDMPRTRRRRPHGSGKRSKRGGGTTPREDSVASSLDITRRLRDAVIQSTRAAAETSSASVAMSRLAREIGEILHDAGISDDTVEDLGRRTTGFLEDLALGVCLAVDRGFDASRVFAARVLRARKAGLWTLPRSLAIDVPAQAIALQRLVATEVVNLMDADRITANLDMRPISQVVHDFGYPFERHAAVTADGYILDLDRLPRPGAKEVLFLMHGVVDSSFCWVANGPDRSLAYKAYERGIDVFMGNFRGTGERAHTNPEIDERDYWQFTVNDHAYSDLPALLAKTREIKAREGCTAYTVTIAAHSMGGAATMMYLVKCGTDAARAPAVDRAILLSPAGVHTECPLLCRATGPIIDRTVAQWVSSFRYPSNLARSLAAKIIQDVKNVPALQDLVAVLAAQLLGGDHEQRNFFRQVDNLTYHSLAGTSSGIFKHFWQIYTNKTFQAFDYGSPEANRARYGSDKPPDILAGYGAITVPCHFIVGLRDNLIAPSNILAQYEKLRSVSPHLAFLKVFPGLGHVDFTYGHNGECNLYVLSLIERAAGKRGKAAAANAAKAAAASLDGFNPIPANEIPVADPTTQGDETDNIDE